MAKPGPGVSGVQKPINPVNSQLQLQDIARRARGGEDLPAAFQQHVQARMGQQGEDVRSYKKGGPVRRTGIFKLHRGEYVAPAKSRLAKAFSETKRR